MLPPRRATPLRARRSSDLARARHSFSSPAPTEGEDLGRTLDFLGEYGPALRVVGREDVRGAPTMDVRTHVDFRRLQRSRTRSEDGRARTSSSRSRASRGRLVDVWVDREGLVRRVRTTRTSEPPAREEFPELPDGWAPALRSLRDRPPLALDALAQRCDGRATTPTIGERTVVLLIELVGDVRHRRLVEGQPSQGSSAST